MRRAHAERSRRRSWSSAQWCAGRTVLPNAKAAPAGHVPCKRTWDVGKYPVKEAKKAKREEEKTVFYLTCDGCLAVRKRESKGLLAGLWELPNVEGKLDAAQALSFAEKAGCEPAELLKSVERVHVFTHIIWRMRCYYIVCREKSPEFVWADAERRKTDVALPTAFRMFVEE
ncbi:MAG: NUDIX domain-containing protein [Oscillospiraceae bacterium]